MTEDEWYGLGEGPKLLAEQQQLQRDITAHEAGLSQAVKDRIAAAAKLTPPGRPTLIQTLPIATQRKFYENEDLLRRYNMRKNAVENARAKKCASLPAPPCNVYRVIASAEAKKIEAEWDKERSQYQARNGLPAGQKVNHRVPKSAGGCPTGDGNLVPDSRLSADCLAADDMMTAAQGDAATRWTLGGF